MKTRLLRKLRREAKRYVKIVNELEYGRYAIILKDKEKKDSNFPISYFHWPSYSAFLPDQLHAWKTDLKDVIEQLPRARRCFINSRLFDIRIELKRTELRKAKLKERKYLNNL